MEHSIENLCIEHRTHVIDIFNYYIENSFAAFFENKVSDIFFDQLMKISEGYPRIAITSDEGEMVGFAFLRPYSPIPTFRQTAEITYFLKPYFTRSGIGKSVLEYLFAEAGKLGIESILASVSSLNEPSINFHLKNGFVQCGTLSKVGKKLGREFDVVWLQRRVNRESRFGKQSADDN